MNQTEVDAAVLKVLVDSGVPWAGLDATHIAERAGLLPADVDEALYRLIRAGEVVVASASTPSRRTRYRALHTGRPYPFG